MTSSNSRRNPKTKQDLKTVDPSNQIVDVTPETTASKKVSSLILFVIILENPFRFLIDKALN